MSEPEQGAPKAVEPTAAPSPEPPAAIAPVVVPRWVQLVVLPLTVLGVYELLRAAGSVLLLFIIAGLIALLLNPFVTFVRRSGLPRGLSVLVVFLSLIVVITGIAVLVSNPIADQVSSIQHNVPGYVDDANA